MPQGHRRKRLEREIFRQISRVLQGEMKDPRLALVTLTRVELSPDLSYARVYVADFEKKKGRDNVITLLKQAKNYIRGRVIQEISIRKHPDLLFVVDKGMDNARAVEAELRKIDEERAAREEEK